MNGMCAKTGKRLSGLEHLRQSIEDILSTRTGLRVMLREYGSALFNLIDAPTNAVVRARMVAATAGALERWELRFKVERVHVELVQGGAISISLTGYYTPTGELIELNGIQI